VRYKMGANLSECRSTIYDWRAIVWVVERCWVSKPELLMF
jgi:hypothetical protein